MLKKMLFLAVLCLSSHIFAAGHAVPRASFEDSHAAILAKRGENPLEALTMALKLHQTCQKIVRNPEQQEQIDALCRELRDEVFQNEGLTEEAIKEAIMKGFCGCTNEALKQSFYTAFHTRFRNHSLRETWQEVRRQVPLFLRMLRLSAFIRLLSLGLPPSLASALMQDPELSSVLMNSSRVRVASILISLQQGSNEASPSEEDQEESASEQGDGDQS